MRWAVGPALGLALAVAPAVLGAAGLGEERAAALLAQGLLSPGARRLVEVLRHARGWRRLEPGHGRRYRAIDRDLRRFCTGRRLDLGLVAGWADAWSRRHPATAREHYVDTPPGSDGGVEALKSACGGDCILTRLRVEIRVLDDAGQGRLRRLRALLWVVGLMAQLHQPLRCIDDRDAHGRPLRARILGRRWSLRGAWDTGLYRAAAPPPARLARQLLLDQRLRPWDREDVDDRSPWVWATESFWVARNAAYPQWNLVHGRYDRAAVGRAWPVLRMQIERAGVRLAEILDAAAR